ncbi:SidA/IucD/PvdA family monooxygenase [Catenulispora sp. NF23]|uniref:L-lysine N6-monooxygenase MbtG n=1 Tax=Catenulispora pinistramenti TaxID=2705254 RepID=A0ABS5KY59_9ACTN|nr:SidA/IucD/PvdA family monooxygenase [Catenulispora pinistramenti]MBS2534403.1 SidA/IucD/PvdA family monooxygenase [Catenulispora pinistramenti]MBS2550952.1 SidA/IucD/PvdA family monooxygenase [Catenulispora pinistramenti]
MSENTPAFHVAAIGAGPSNLSLAALYQACTQDRGMVLFDRQPGPSWHATLLHPGVDMQTSWLKDLVTVVDPTHRLSFLNYLVTSGRFYALNNSQFDSLPRREYQRYLAWAAGQIDNLHFGVDIDEISLGADGFQLSSAGVAHSLSEHVVVGVGTRPAIPAQLSGLPEDRVFIADRLVHRLPEMAVDKTVPVAVLGGGQTGCEAVLRLIGEGFTAIRWIGRGQWFRTIDDSPIANEFYRPEHQQFLQGLTLSSREKLVRGQRSTGDALTPGGMRAVYQANYHALLETGSFAAHIMVGHDVVGATAEDDQVVLRCETSEQRSEIPVAYAVVAMGRERTPIPFDDELRERVDFDDNGEVIVESDYSIRWKGSNGHRIYALNRARFSHGIPDANLTLLPVRSALIVNSMLEREVYRLPENLCAVTWG